MPARGKNDERSGEFLVALAVQPAAEGLGQLVESPVSGTGVNDPPELGPCLSADQCPCTSP